MEPLHWFVGAWLLIIVEAVLILALDRKSYYQDKLIRKLKVQNALLKEQKGQ